MTINLGCMGYIKLACKAIGMTDTKIGKRPDEVYFQFDVKTKAEAEQAYHNIRLDREDD